MTWRRPFAVAIEDGLASGNLEEALRPFETIEAPDDAYALLAVMDRLPVRDKGFGSPLGVVARAFQSAEGEAAHVLRAEGMPRLHALYDRSIKALDEGEAVRLSDIVFVLKIYALYASTGGLARIVTAARDTRLHDEFLWSIVFGIYSHNDHPLSDDLVLGLKEPLPCGFCAVAFLDACNTLAREKRLSTHPFASADGISRLRDWLADQDPEHFSYAHSATAALPFVEAEHRSPLMDLAFAHPSAEVRLEAAWADAASGGQSGLNKLVAACRDYRWARSAMAYLKELEREDRIPAETKDPAFAALAELSDWLAHPSELGRAPDKLEVYDTRILHWPPTNDRRRLWLLRYEKGGEAGLGLVGSITFALFGESTADLSPEDAYALHCCWELQMNGDPRAPAERTIAAGRALLGLLPN